MKDYALAMKYLANFEEMKMKPNFSTLAKKTHINRHTLSNMYYGRRNLKPRERQSELDKYKNEISDLLKDQMISITAAYFYLSNESREEKQIKCTLSNFFKYVKKHNLNVKDEKHVAHFRYETDPGKQLQVDWVENLKISTNLGEAISFNLFSATLGYSRMHYFEFTIGKTEEDFKRCLVNAFNYFGGKTKEVLTDNMSAIVNVDEHREKTIHPTIVQFFKDLDVELKLCKTRTPQTKGKCETSNKFVKWLYAYNGKIKDEFELYELINRLNKTINYKVSNQFLGVPPAIFFKKEKELLTELTNMDRQNLHEAYARTSKVPSTGLINYNGKQYSVDSKFIGKNVKVIQEGNKINIFHRSILITTHNVSDKKINYAKEHYVKFLTEKKIDTDKIEEYSQKNLEGFKNYE